MTDHHDAAAPAVATRLVVEVAGQRFELDGTQPFAFGRDSGACDVTLGTDPFDPGISRWAGSLDYDQGVWWITNRSSTRTLHVVDVETGIGVPLPVVRENRPPARHAVDRERMTILVEGAIKTHALAVTAPPQPTTTPQRRAFVDATPTQNLLPALSDKQREALVALVEPYLWRFPRYRPEPKTYDGAARRLGVPSSTVRRRVENLRTALIDRGVGGLDSGDARRNLAEWLLSNRIITRTDLEWLERRLAKPPEQ